MNYIIDLGRFFRVCVLVLMIPSFVSVAGEKNVSKSGNLRVSTFDVDATPPVGNYLAYDPMINTWDMGLRAKGIVILGKGKPVVLCVVDWIGISNDSQDAFKRVLAEAAGTVPDRVAVHTIHVHDAPISDFGAEKLLKEAGRETDSYEGSYQRETIRQLGIAVKNSLEKAQTVTHIGLGQAQVYEVASNRRILGPDGKVKTMRHEGRRNPALQALPEGLIDPMVSLVSFWNNDQPVAVLSYYATHPQSYYRTGVANPDFVGVARFMRQVAVPQALHVHFNGAGGNISSGKYNDGAKEWRGIMAGRLADGMKRAWDSSKKVPVTANNMDWNFIPVALPHSPLIEGIQSEIKTQTVQYLTNNLFKTVWLKRLQEGKKININCLTLGKARILLMPGELFVEYQLAAKKMRPDLFVAMAAYGDYATGYICTAKAYEEGGYEAGIASAVTPEAEPIVMKTMQKLLKK